MEEQRSLNVHNVERNIMDSIGYGAAHHPTNIHRMEDGKETEKETAREPTQTETENHPPDPNRIQMMMKASSIFIASC